MTIHVNIGAAKTRLSQLLAAIRRGEEVIITRDGEPEARLLPVDPDANRKAIAEKRRRFYGSWKGKVTDNVDWFAPLTEAELAEWYDAPLYNPPVIDESAA